MMRLGTQTNSLTNHILSRAVIGQPEPEVGMGATILCWTDRNAATITKVWTWRKSMFVTVQEDTAKRVDKNGLSECQVYEFSPNPNGATYTFRRLGDGRWQGAHFNTKTQRWSKSEGEGLRIGERNKYRDFSF